MAVVTMGSTSVDDVLDLLRQVDNLGRGMIAQAIPTPTPRPIAHAATKVSGGFFKFGPDGKMIFPTPDKVSASRTPPGTGAGLSQTTMIAIGALIAAAAAFVYLKKTRKI